MRSKYSAPASRWAAHGRGVRHGRASPDTTDIGLRSETRSEEPGIGCAAHDPFSLGERAASWLASSMVARYHQKIQSRYASW